MKREYTPETAPGLGANPGFVHSEVTGGIDWRTSPGYSRTGGYYGLTLHRFDDPDNTFTFKPPRRERRAAHPRAERNVGAVGAGPHADDVR